MEIPTEYIPIIGPITAATLAGAVAYMVSVLSKEQKTSEFRQAWIDGLRADIAELLALTSSINYLLAFRHSLKHTEDQISEYLLTKEDDLRKAYSLSHRIYLRVNPKEHKKLLEKIEKISEIDWQEDSGHELLEKATYELIEESQAVLKKEWKRVKRGEPVFFFTKWISFLIFICAIFFLIKNVY